MPDENEILEPDHPQEDDMDESENADLVPDSLAEVTHEVETGEEDSDGGS